MPLIVVDTSVALPGDALAVADREAQALGPARLRPVTFGRFIIDHVSRLDVPWDRIDGAWINWACGVGSSPDAELEPALDAAGDQSELLWSLPSTK